MTVSTEIVSHSYFPGASMLPENILFQYLDVDDVVVADEAATVQVAGTDYVLTGNGRTRSGVITTLHAYPDTARLTLYRKTARIQQAQTQPFQPLPAEQVERELDRRAMVEQEIDNVVVRSILVPMGETGGTMPPLAERAGFLAVFSPEGGLIAVPSFGVTTMESDDDGIWNPADPLIDDGEWG